MLAILVKGKPETDFCKICYYNGMRVATIWVGEQEGRQISLQKLKDAQDVVLVTCYLA